MSLIFDKPSKHIDSGDYTYTHVPPRPTDNNVTFTMWADFLTSYGKLFSKEPKLAKMYDDAMQLLVNKNHDYANDQDFYANFRKSLAIGIPEWKAVLIRLSDKFSRLQEFAKKGEFVVKDEQLRDTVLDIINYSAILCRLYEDGKDAEKTGKTNDQKIERDGD